MGVNWDSGLIYWRDHTPVASENYSLSHLHPFIQTVELPSTLKHPARSARLHVSFGLHTFTRSIQPHDGDHGLYRDNREVRTFCKDRYARSTELPHIIRTLAIRPCEFARGLTGRVNYVTVEAKDGVRYAAFFDLRRFAKAGANAVHLMVQSAYALDPNKPAPGRGRIGFMHFSAMRCEAQSRDRLAEASIPGRINAKPRSWRGLVSPDPLTCRRGRPLARRARTKPAFVHPRMVWVASRIRKSNDSDKGRIWTP